jgi:formylglycine-generating enzyme required for sulfatase activity
MFKFLTPHLALHALLALLRADAASPAVDAVRDSLQALAHTLSFQGNIYDTYAPIQDKATEAYRTIASASDRSIPDSRAQNVRWSLERVLVECQYYVSESSNPEYLPGALEVDDYLTASVAEWQFAVKFMNDHLEEPFCNITIDQPSLGAKSIFREAEPGTVFSDSPGLPDMVVIPTGSYVAGSTPEEYDTWHVDDNRRAFEYPQRNVTIKKPLAFSRTEVTVPQFAGFLQHTCYQPPGGTR